MPPQNFKKMNIRLLTVKAAAKLIDRDTSRIYRWISEGKLAKYVVNGVVCVNLDDLYLAESVTEQNTRERITAAREKKQRRVV